MRIKELLTEKRITSKTLSQRTGITEMGISNMITGKSSPTAESIMKIASALGVKCGELFDDYEPEKSPLPSNITLKLDGNEYDVILSKK